MIIPLLAAALYCPTPQLDNKTATWTENDQKAILEIGKHGCKDFDPKQPCLVLFTKNAEGDYTAQCGPEVPRPEK